VVVGLVVGELVNVVGEVVGEEVVIVGLVVGELVVVVGELVVGERVNVVGEVVGELVDTVGEYDTSQCLCVLLDRAPSTTSELVHPKQFMAVPALFM
jgi:hypothetical protein